MVESLRVPIINTTTEDITKWTKTEGGHKIKLWVGCKKSLFFDALHEFGKDFDKIHNYFNTKIKRLYGNVDTNHVVKKEQIKDFYANTLRKANSLVDIKRLHHLIVDDSSIEEQRVKEYRELIVLSCWWQIMKHEKKLKYSTEKLKIKINEIIFNGTTVIRIKKQNVYLQQQLPKCLSHKTKDKVPQELTVDILPHNNWSWSVVQNVAQNPRIRLKVSSKKSVSDIVGLLLTKWEKAQEQCSIQPLTLHLHSPSPHKYQIKLPDNNRRNSSSTQCENKKKSSTIDTETITSNEAETPLQTNDAETPLQTNGAEMSLQTNDIETPLQSNDAETPLQSNGSEMPLQTNDTEIPLQTNDAEIPSNSSSTEADWIKYSTLTNESITAQYSSDISQSMTDFEAPDFSNGFFGRKVHRKESEEELAERKRLLDLWRWSIDTPSSLTIGHIYAEFCNKEKKDFYIEYEWSSKESVINSTHNCMALKRLFNLASTEFQKLSRQSRYQDLFMTVNVERWNTPLPSYRNCETQTVNETTVKIKTVSVAIQAGKDRLILPQPTKLGGFLVPSPPPIMPNKKVPSFALPKRRTAKRKLHRAILPKVNDSTCSIRLVVPRDVTTDAIASPCQSPNAQGPIPQYYGQDTYFNDWDSNDHFFAQFKNSSMSSPPHTGLDCHSNQLPSNQLPSNQLPSNQLPSNQLPSNQLPSSSAELQVPVLDDDDDRGDHDKMITLLHCDDSLL